MKNLIKLNDITGGPVLINPRNIVGVNAYDLKANANAEVICVIGKYYVKETLDEIDFLVNGKIADSKSKPKIGDNYFYFDLVNEELISDVYLDNDFDKFNIKYGNCFKDRESALAINSNDKSILLKSLIEIRKHGREY